MSNIKIITNNHWRDLICWAQLTQAEQSDFDYIEGEDRYSLRLLRYRGCVVDTRDMMSLGSELCNPGRPDEFSAWDAYASDSFFSGVLVRYSPDCEQVQIATYVS